MGLCQLPSPSRGPIWELQGYPGLCSVPGTESRFSYILGVKTSNIRHENQLLSQATPILDRDLSSTSSLLHQAAVSSLPGPASLHKGSTAAAERICESRG